jgi:hypothetical protein
MILDAKVLFRSSFKDKHILLFGDHKPLSMEWYLYEKTALNVPCSPPYAHHRLGGIEIVLFTAVALNPGLGSVGIYMTFYYCP